MKCGTLGVQLVVDHLQRHSDYHYKPDSPQFLAANLPAQGGPAVGLWLSDYGHDDDASLAVSLVHELKGAALA